MRKQGVFLVVSAIAMLWAGTAAAGVGKLLGDLVNPDSAYAGFLGTWSLASPDGGDIDHLVVSESGSGQVRIQVFGRCENRICNWGALPGRVRTDGPTSSTVLSLSADYNLGYALRHITLHRANGGALRFEMVTEFTDGSDRRDYEASAQLVAAGSRAVAQAAPPAAASSGVVPVAAPAAGDVQPVVANSILGEDDCISFDTDHSYVVTENGNWKVRDFLHTVQDFGPNQAAARKAITIIGYYRMAEVCRVGRGALAVFRIAGEVPRQAMKGEDCSDVRPEKVQAVQRDGDWTVMEGDRELFTYGSDGEAAAKATTVIKSLNLNRQCYFDRSNTPASYWLSR